MRAKFEKMCREVQDKICREVAEMDGGATFRYEATLGSLTQRARPSTVKAARRCVYLCKLLQGGRMD
jgi:hypothetical protein